MCPSQTEQAAGSNVANAPPRTAGEICAIFSLSPEAQGLLQPEMPPADLLHALIERGLYDDAIRLLAYGLEPAQAVWWGTLCAWHVLRQQDEPRPADLAAVETILGWLEDPSEEHRYAAKRAKQEAGPGSLAGCIAQAVYFSGGSISYPGLPEVIPEDGAFGRLISTGLLNSIKSTRSTEPQRARQFLHFGIEVAQGQNGWQRETTST